MTQSISADDRGFTLGDGVFDTALALGGVMVARRQHMERLLAAARVIGIELESEAVQSAIDAQLEVSPCIIRTTVSRGVAARGLWPASTGRPTLIVTAAPWTSALLGQDVRLSTATTPRNERSPLSNLKTLGYLDNILAARDALAQGADDALILNTGGRVACTTMANLFALKDGRLVTPPLREGVLPGIARGLVLDCARALDLAVDEAPLRPAQLREADAVFTTNSVRLLRRVTVLDGIALPHREPDTLARLSAGLCATIAAECGVDPRAAA